MPTPKSSPKLDVAIAELTVLMTQATKDIGEIKNRLSVMDENFARKDEVAANKVEIGKLKDEISTLRTQLAVTATKLATWGIVGGIIITLLAAAISALQIHL